MKDVEALEVANALIAGCNPVTGEMLPRGSAVRERRVVEALLVLATAVEDRSAKEQRRAERKRQVAVTWDLRASNQGLPWSTDEDDDLGDAFLFGQSMEEIAKRHRRTVVAIVSRLEKRGDLDHGSAAALRASQGTAAAGSTRGPTT